MIGTNTAFSHIRPSVNNSSKVKLSQSLQLIGKYFLEEEREKEGGPGSLQRDRANVYRGVMCICTQDCPPPRGYLFRQDLSNAWLVGWAP